MVAKKRAENYWRCAGLRVIYPFFFWVFFLHLLFSCAAKERGRRTAEDFLPTDPTPANFSSWREAWDGERWNLVMKSRHPQLPALRVNFASSLATELQRLQDGLFEGALESPEIFNGSFARLPQLNVEEVPGRKGCPVTLCPTFLIATIASQKMPWSKLFSFSALENLRMQHTNSIGVFQLFWNALGNMEDVKFAEPDLKSPTNNFLTRATALAEDEVTPETNAPPTEGTPDPAEAENREYVHHVKNIKIIEAEKEEKARNLNLREIVVAVLDTGIDSANPHLKDRMFKLPGRESATTPGIFKLAGKSYLGDVFGIDSSWEEGLSGDSQKFSPGSADIGGPGVECPGGEGADSDGILPSPSGTKCSHGTHVGGLVAAKDFLVGDGKTYGRGVCRNCKLLPIRVARSVAGPPPNNGPILDSSQIRGLQFVLGLQSSTGSLFVNVVNMSIGQLTSSRGMRTVVDAVYGSGIIVVAASANYNTDRPYFPAAYDNVLSVCATSVADSRGTFNKANFSNFGEWVDICAPGEGIWSTAPGQKEKMVQSGTSMASPIVAGAAGYLMGLADALKVNVDGRSFRIMNTMLERSNWEALYRQAGEDGSQNNEAYQFELPDKTGVEFLGRGFLDVQNSLTGARASNRVNAPGAQVEGGCVVSSVARQRRTVTKAAPENFAEIVAKILGSLPGLLGLFALACRFGRRTIGARAMPSGLGQIPHTLQTLANGSKCGQ